MKGYVILALAIVQIKMVAAQKSNTIAAQHTQTVHFVFQHSAGDALLQNGKTYTNAFGEPFTVRAFKYYISNIQLEYAGQHIKAEGKHKYEKVNIAPHLVNDADSTTKHLNFSAPAGVIIGIQFFIGVDSIVNTTGVQTGDLDPAKGMYWIWNTGYIMAKLEGFSPVAKSPGHQFTYDIGGYKWGEDAGRKINLSVPPYINYKTTSTFLINADVLKWFSGVHDVKIAAQPMCHQPGTLAMQIADNYQHLFSVISNND